MATPKRTPETSARDRLLAAATELFYAEGVHTVGIDRVIERAGVAKASLYSTFGSKDELVRAYLTNRAEARQFRIAQRIAPFEHDPRAQILAVFDALADLVAQPTFRGCAFVNASAEGPRGDTSISRVCEKTRRWQRDLFTDLARSLDVAKPEVLARQLVLLYDGAVVGASMDRDGGTAASARAMAELLIAAAPRRKAASKRR